MKEDDKGEDITIFQTTDGTNLDEQLAVVMEEVIRFKAILKAELKELAGG